MAGRLAQKHSLTRIFSDVRPSISTEISSVKIRVRMNCLDYIPAFEFSDIDLCNINMELTIPEQGIYFAELVHFVFKFLLRLYHEMHASSFFLVNRQESCSQTGISGKLRDVLLFITCAIWEWEEMVITILYWKKWRIL